VGEPISIPLDRIRSGKISDFERLILALAGRPGDARLLDSNTLQITLNRPLIVDTLGGQFDAVAARGVSAAEKTGDLLVRRVSATVGPVKLIADGKIFKSGSAVTFFSNLVESNQVSNWVVQGNATAALADSQQAVVLAIPSSATSSSAAWLSKPVSLQAFRADFEIVPGGTRGHEDLAFILQTVGTGVVGQPLAGAGVAGIPGRKIAVQISLDSSRRNRPSVRISGLGRGIRSSRLGFPLTGGALYVTIAYDPARKSFEVTVADRIAGKPGCKQKTIYVKGDLSAALSSQTATVGFTSGTSKQPIFAQIQNFNFATDSNASRIAGNHIAFGKGNVADWRDSNKAPGTYWKFRSPSALSFQSRTPGTRDAITWYQEAVSTGSFQLNFDVDLPPASRRPDRLTFSLVPANSSDTRDNLTLSSLDSRSFSFALDLLGHKAGIEATRLAGTMESVGDLRLASGRVHVILQYDATRHTFSINLTDSRGRQFTQTFEGIDLLSILGADAAWIGFGSSGPSTHQSKLTIRDLRFLQPGKVSDGVNSWKLMGGIQSISGELLTVPDEATAATASWYPHLLSTGGFTATFDYRLNLRGTRRAAGGSGMALVLQTDPAGPQAVSATTAGFGYRDIAGPKLGLLFGINDNGIPGVQLNQGSVSGKFLKVPWLASGKVSMTIVYDETTHAISLTLRNSRGSVFEHTWTEMDLGKVLGGYVGWLGFTSGCTRKALAQHIGNFRWFSLGAIRSLGGSSAVSLLSLQNGTSDTTPVTE